MDLEDGGSMEVVEAVYENGVLKLKKKLNLLDGTEVSVELIPKKYPTRPLEL
jgi:predicted DNA-binding antitoxin AbrB/MazE fold protein